MLRTHVRSALAIPITMKASSETWQALNGALGERMATSVASRAETAGTRSSLQFRQQALNAEAVFQNAAMDSGSSGGCSTELEASASNVSEQYDEDDFDDYSDSFEPEDDEVDASFKASSIAAFTELVLLPLGTRVQVFWKEENAWFDGAVESVEAANEPRYFVRYDDGEQQWENAANTRPLPARIASTAPYEQLQQLVPLSAQGVRSMIGRRAIVYWPDEAEWYAGVVGAAQTYPTALKIEYDDGDDRWEQEHVFNCILLLRTTIEAPDAPQSPVTAFRPMLTPTPSSPPERVLYARPYRQAVSDHFQPVRISRPYRCAVDKHSESVLVPRRSYSERRYLHKVHQVLESSRFTQQATSHSLFSEKADSVTQTALTS